MKAKMPTAGAVQVGTVGGRKARYRRGGFATKGGSSRRQAGRPGRPRR